MQISGCIPVASVCRKNPHFQVVLPKDMQMQQFAPLSHRGHTALMRSSMLQGNVLRHLLTIEQTRCTGRLCCDWHSVVAAKAEDKPGERYKHNDLRCSM